MILINNNDVEVFGVKPWITVDILEPKNDDWNWDILWDETEWEFIKSKYQERLNTYLDNWFEEFTKQ